MVKNRMRLVVAVVFSFIGSASYAQFGSNPLDRPEIRMFLNPVVGSSATYKTTSNSNSAEKNTFEIMLLSEESVEGKTGYWVEIAIQSPTMAGPIYGKNLLVPGEGHPRKLVIQYPGTDPMEMPIRDNPAAKRETVTKTPVKIGTETITVPAGTFVCDHWKDESGEETWTNSKVGPLTVVKSVNSVETKVLIKNTTGAKDHITGTVKPFDPRAFAQAMRQATGKQ